MIFASGLRALLPAVARDQLRLGAGGYGLLLGSMASARSSGSTGARQDRDGSAGERSDAR
jgi:hypothetical protein